MTRTLLGLLLIAAIAVTAACGGSGGGSDGERVSKEEYEQALQQGGSAIEGSFQTLATNIEELGGQDIASLDEASELFDQMAAEIQTVVDALRDSADELTDITPPEDVEGEHADLIQGVSLLADDFERFAEIVQSGDFEAIFTEAGMIADLEDTEAGQLLQSSVEGIESKGYDPG